MKKIVTIPLILGALSCSNICWGVDPVATPISEPAASETNCIDQVISKAIVDPKLHSDFYEAKDASYPFHIIEHKDGHLENTLGGEITKEDATKIEHTAKCISSHQGEHLMSFCDAELTDEGLSLHVRGGLPAYSSSLTLLIDKEKSLKCSFTATYPMIVPGEKLSWTITKKDFKMTNDTSKSGERLFAWLSVEFDETCVIDGKTSIKSHKIEGFIKPIISDPIQDQKQ